MKLTSLREEFKQYAYWPTSGGLLLVNTHKVLVQTYAWQSHYTWRDCVRMFERTLDDPSHIWRDCSDNIKSWWWDNSWGVRDRSTGCCWLQVRWETLTPRRAEGEPKILNIPKILGGVVAATTNGEPLVESSISVNITTIVSVRIMMQGNIEPVSRVPFVLHLPFTGMPNPCASTKSRYSETHQREGSQMPVACWWCEDQGTGFIILRIFKVSFWCCSAASRPGQYPGGVTSRNHKRCSAAS